MSRLDPMMIQRAADTIAGADALIIAAGAGMGVDSGLPDFRGPEGFWRAYPPFRKLGLKFEQVAQPSWFEVDPALAWGFYGHRGNLYRRTPPHEGFAILRRWADRPPSGGFVITSNVDAHFTRAKFLEQRIYEVHGSIEWRQCLRSCGIGIFPAGDPDVLVDESTFRAPEPRPSCPVCGSLTRPNILMFGDSEWDPARSEGQRSHLENWVATWKKQARHVRPKLTVVEIGAGTGIPTIRRICESLAKSFDGTLIRINPREPEVPPGHFGLAAGALETIRALDALLPSGPDR